MTDDDFESLIAKTNNLTTAELSEALPPRIVLLACVFSSILRDQPENVGSIVEVASAKSADQADTRTGATAAIDVSELRTVVDSHDTAASKEEKRLSDDHEVRETTGTPAWRSKTRKYKDLLKTVTEFSGWMNLYGSEPVPRSKKKLFHELESSAVKDSVPGVGDVISQRLADCECSTVAHLAASYRQFLRPGVPRPFGWFSVFLKECCKVTEEEVHRIALFTHLFTRLRIS